MTTIPASNTRAMRAALKLHEHEMEQRRLKFARCVAMLTATLDQFPDEPTMALWRAFNAGADFKHEN